MKKRIILILSLILCLVIVPTVTIVIASQIANSKEWRTPTYKEMEATDIDNDKGSLKYEVSDDKSKVTISYNVNGEKRSYTVPNKANYTCGGFAATDDLERELPNSMTTGIYGSNGEYYVGLFYFLWMGEHGDSGIFDSQKNIDKYGSAAGKLSCGGWGPQNAMHFFAEPLYGYYYSKDEWVMQKHMELISNANIDFLYLDVTNGFSYISNAKKLMQICHNLNEQGFDAPQIVFYTHSSSQNVIKEVYNSIYSQNFCPDTWFYVDGKPCIIADSPSYNINNFFTLRSAQWPNEAARTDTAWPWMDFEWPQRVFLNQSTGIGESISVSVAQHSGSIRFSSSAFYGDKSNRGRSCTGKSDAVSSTPLTEDSYLYGYNFQNQWDNVFNRIKQSKTDKTKNVKYVLVTGWNEWVAQRQGKFSDTQDIWLVDTASVEFSRDVEMTRGYYFDNYYLQMIANTQKLKGSAPVIVQDARNHINVTGDFRQWDNVLVTYKDAIDDCKDRNAPCFGNGTYTDTSGRNDIANAKVTSDSKNIYFYVNTKDDISEYDNNSSWMQLFVNTDNDATNGWYGYDYIINYSAVDQYTTTVAKLGMNSDKTYSAKTVGKVNYQVSGNEMMIAVPMELLGIKGYKEVYLEYKWADANIVLDTMEEFYTNGDVAPLGRLNWIYQNYIPGVSKVVYQDETVSTENAPDIDISLLDIYKNATNLNGTEYNNYVQSAKLKDGYISLTSGGEDPYVTLIPLKSNVTVPSVIAIKYRTTANDDGGEFFIGSGSGWHGGTDEVKFSYINDGKWHVKYIDISQCLDVTNNKVAYMRYDFFNDGSGSKTIDIAYVSFFESVTKAKEWEKQLNTAEETEPGITRPTIANEVTLEKILENTNKSDVRYSNNIKYAELSNGYLNLTAGTVDPYVTLLEIGSNKKIPDIIAVKYRTIAEGGGEFFIGSGSGWHGGTDEVKFDYINDGNWHVLYVDVKECKDVSNNIVNYLRYDFFTDGAGEKSIDIAYVGFFDKKEDAPQ